MKAGVSGLRWGVEQRLEFIEFRLFWESGINRADITRYFGVSVPQASKDLSQYQEIAPRNIRYDRSEKRYFATDDFEPVFLRPNASRYLSHINAIAGGVQSLEETWISQVPDFDLVLMPHRNIDPNALRTVLSAIRGRKAVEVKYQSMSLSRPKPSWRWISPHAIGFDGMRWHARAFCHIEEKFKDFLLPRILGVRKIDAATASPDEDHIWREVAVVYLVPHPGLTPDQQNAVARDYGMKQNKLRVEVRLALLYYFLRRQGLDFHETEESPREQHVVLGNPDEVKVALDRANYRSPVQVAE